MWQTEVGYCGGSTPAPTYRDIGDHAEALQLHFDPAVVSLDTLLSMFWSGHDPTEPRGSQYRAAVFAADDAQLAAIRKSASALERAEGIRVATQITGAAPFHSAEGYHQKWRLRRQDLVFDALQRHYRDEDALLRSSAAAKLNGYVGGHATQAQLERDLPKLDLPPAILDEVRDLARSRAR